MPNNITVILPSAANDIIEKRKPLGLFLTIENNMWIAIDNLTGDAWTEEFYNSDIAIKWLSDRTMEVK